MNTQKTHKNIDKTSLLISGKKSGIIQIYASKYYRKLNGYYCLRYFAILVVQEAKLKMCLECF